MALSLDATSPRLPSLTRPRRRGSSAAEVRDDRLSVVSGYSRLGSLPHGAEEIAEPMSEGAKPNSRGERDILARHCQAHK